MNSIWRTEHKHLHIFLRLILTNALGQLLKIKKKIWLLKIKNIELINII